MTQPVDGKPSIQSRVTKPNAGIGRISAIIYGKTGVGKTTLLGTMPGKGLVIDIPQNEGGAYVLSDKSDRIDVVPVTTWNDFEELYEWLRDRTKHQYSWVAIDSMTAAQGLAKRKATKERTLDADPYMTTMQDYGKIGNLMDDLNFKFRMLPVHSIFIAQEASRAGDGGGTAEVEPDMTPATAKAVRPPQSLIGRLFIQEVDVDGKAVYERRLRVGPHPVYVTKCRAVPGREVPAVIKNPNLTQIFGWLLGKEGATQPEGIEEQTVSFMV